MDREQIIDEIRRTASLNGGTPPGYRRFLAEMGISDYDFSKYWPRWSDAVRDAGLEPNEMTVGYDESFLIEKLIELTREIGRVPTNRELVHATRCTVDLPSERTFRRMGSKAQRAKKVIAYCEANPGHEDIADLWRQVPLTRAERLSALADSSQQSVGYVYLIKHGSRREYKIGRTTDPVRREGEIAIQLPEKLEPVHYIKTDDPSGVEAYWHRRFAAKRKEGEWFELTATDVRAFKRWKRIF